MTDTAAENAGAEMGPELDLNVNGGDPITPEPVDDPEEEVTDA